MDFDRLSHDVRGGDLPPDAEEGRRGPCDLSWDQGGLSRLPLRQAGQSCEGLSNKTYPLYVVGCVAPTEIRCRDANCRTVVPSQVDLFRILRCGDTPRWVMCETARSRVGDEGTPQSALEEPGLSRRIIVTTRRYGPGSRAWYPYYAPNIFCRDAVFFPRR